MSRMLVLYGTTEGHTRKIAAAIGETLREQGIDVDIVEAGTVDPRADNYDGVVVAGSVHGGTYQRLLQRWVRDNAQRLAGRPSAFVSVSLAVLQTQPEVRREVAATVERFLTATGWRPSCTKSIAGALVYTKYNWLKRWIMRRITAKAGGDVDTSRDYEYTDWQDLRSFVEQFGRTVIAAGSTSAA